MASSKKRNFTQATPSRPDTEVTVTEDFGTILTELVAFQSREALKELAETVEHLRREFDPASVTMSSTNIPDSITKLAAVLAETTQATTKVFQLVDEQKGLLVEGDIYLAELETLAQKGSLDPQALGTLVAKCRGVHQKLGSSAHQIVVSQEFQDLSGQKVKKVIKLLSGVETYLRTLLNQLKVPLPSPYPGGESEQHADIDQAAADSILKDFGL